MGPSAAERASVPVQLDPTLINEIVDRVSDAIVERVVEAIKADGIIPHGRATIPWLDAKQVAELLGVERDWVYEHAEELGALKIGTGPRPRLRFPPQIPDAQGRNRTSAEPSGQPAKRRSKPGGLIPIHAS